MAPNSWNLFKAPRYRGFTIRRSLLKGVCKRGRVEVSLSMNNCIKRPSLSAWKSLSISTTETPLLVHAFARINTSNEINFSRNFISVYQFILSDSIFALRKYSVDSVWNFCKFRIYRARRLRIQFSNNRYKT